MAAIVTQNKKIVYEAIRNNMNDITITLPDEDAAGLYWGGTGGVYTNAAVEWPRNPAGYDMLNFVGLAGMMIASDSTVANCAVHLIDPSRPAPFIMASTPTDHLTVDRPILYPIKSSWQTLQNGVGCLVVGISCNTSTSIWNSVSYKRVDNGQTATMPTMSPINPPKLKIKLFLKEVPPFLPTKRPPARFGQSLSPVGVAGAARMAFSCNGRRKASVLFKSLVNIATEVTLDVRLTVLDTSNNEIQVWPVGGGAERLTPLPSLGGFIEHREFDIPDGAVLMLIYSDKVSGAGDGSAATASFCLED